MTTYTITVNGKDYDVAVVKNKTMAGAAAAITPKVVFPAAAPVLPASVAAPAVPAPAPAPAAAAGNAYQVAAPMPGKVIAVKVNIGETVRKGQELLIVEAMKMHNPILSQADGVVQSVCVKAGDPVQTGTKLVSIS
ncbi:biotin/lipoyl-containing protein [Sporomusa sp.]|uniref:biotin/lipoyl-containing protein n=1 Tax=Sporomusa sp. TaxID=2078658 RepID=UPI002C2189EB|nr:biotin/lipoyl-containing protein [Sporomusa sp.]HWR45972.1 biotin/lipoyl-containing protein [Sporomusa sp.]